MNYPNWQKCLPGDNIPTRNPDLLGDLIAAFEAKKEAHGFLPSEEAFFRALNEPYCPSHMLLFYGQRIGMEGYWGTQEMIGGTQWVRLDNQYYFDTTGPHILGCYRLPFFDEQLNPREPSAALLLQGMSRRWQHNMVDKHVPYGGVEFVEEATVQIFPTNANHLLCSMYDLLHDIKLSLGNGYDNIFTEGFVVPDQETHSPIAGLKNPLEMTEELIRLNCARDIT